MSGEINFSGVTATLVSDMITLSINWFHSLLAVMIVKLFYIAVKNPRAVHTSDTIHGL